MRTEKSRELINLCWLMYGLGWAVGCGLWAVGCDFFNCILALDIEQIKNLSFEDRAAILPSHLSTQFPVAATDSIPQDEKSNVNTNTSLGP